MVNNLPDVTFMLTEGGAILTMPFGASYRLEARQTNLRDPLQTNTLPILIMASDPGAISGEEAYAEQERVRFPTDVSLVGGDRIIDNAGAPLSELTMAVDSNADGTLESTVTPVPDEVLR